MYCHCKNYNAVNILYNILYIPGDRCLLVHCFATWTFIGSSSHLSGTMHVMFSLFVIVGMILCCTDAQSSLNGMNHFLKTPVSAIQTGGRLTERQLGYIAQDGYKSILSVVEFATNDTSFNGVNGSYPSTEYEMSIAKSYGMEAKYVISSLTPQSAYAISDIIKTLPSPVFIHCHVKCIFILFYSYVFV